MTRRGYDKPLCILPFDHRGSFQTRMFGSTGALSAGQTAQVASVRQIIYDGFKAAIDATAHGRFQLVVMMQAAETRAADDIREAFVRAARSDLALDVTGKLFSEEEVFRRQLRTGLEHQPQKPQHVSEKSERRSQHVCRIRTSATRHHRVDCGKRAE